jgi:transcriptional regulator GlxA family with amidase domain
VRIDTDYLHREMSRILDRPASVPDHLDLADSAGAEWLRLVQSLSATQFTQALVNEQLCGAIAASFILAARPDDEPQAARPRVVKRVLDEMHADPARPWTAGDMAEISGVSLRRLQESFRQNVGVSPREYLLDIRLSRVRDELRHPECRRTVTDIALDWGFTHTGRFALAYRRKYGESPSQTRRT